MKKLWDRIKKAPLICGIIIGSMILTVAGMLGWDNIYAMQEKDPVQTPVLASVFAGINDGVYPWQMFDPQVREEATAQKQKLDAMKDQTAENKEPAATVSSSPSVNPTVVPSPTVASSSAPLPAMTALPSSSPSNIPSPSPSPTPAFPEGRLEPLRESTYDEYINHISADIYGDMGVQRAASYEYTQVDESYFDDALFIGDSRTVGLHDYTDLSEHADFLCETSLTIYKVMEERFKGMGTVEEVLNAKEYGKIYLMVGINELGRGTTEDYMEKYTEVVDTLHALAPQAKIIIQANMRVSGTKSSSDAIFNNGNINARNNAVATLADNETFFYIDMNEVLCDENGDLTAEYTHDQIHLLGKYNELWKQFLLSHGV